MLDVNFMFDVQVATHLKGLAEKAKLNEKHVKSSGFIRRGWPLLLLSGLSCKNGRSV